MGSEVLQHRVVRLHCQQRQQRLSLPTARRPATRELLTASTSAPSSDLASSRATLPVLAPGSLSHRFSRCRMSATEAATLPA
jgi:hypothetical protein